MILGTKKEWEGIKWNKIKWSGFTNSLTKINNINIMLLGYYAKKTYIYYSTEIYIISQNKAIYFILTKEIIEELSCFLKKDLPTFDSIENFAIYNNRNNIINYIIND